MKHALILAFVISCGVDVAPVEPPDTFDDSNCQFWHHNALDLTSPHYCLTDGNRRIGPVQLRREFGSNVLVPMVVERLGDQCVVTDCLAEIKP